MTNTGYCSICRRESRFTASDSWLRDSYLCAGCGTIPRQRALMEVLNIVSPDWRSLTLHESSPTIPFLRQCEAYSCSFYFPEIPPGLLHSGGSRCENLERLTFPDASFDLFVTQDVLEHVFHPDLAAQEIMRVLKPGGAHVFTTPRHPLLPASRCRARVAPDGAIEHLFDPIYHGNPIDPQGSLVTWDYGADFDNLISRWSGYLISCYVIRDRARGIDGEFLDVWATRKDPVNATSI